MNLVITLELQVKSQVSRCKNDISELKLGFLIMSDHTSWVCVSKLIIAFPNSIFSKWTFVSKYENHLNSFLSFISLNSKSAHFLWIYVPMIFGRFSVKYLLQTEDFSVIFEDFENVTVRSEYLIFIKPVWLSSLIC